MSAGFAPSEISDMFAPSGAGDTGTACTLCIFIQLTRRLWPLSSITCLTASWSTDPLFWFSFDLPTIRSIGMLNTTTLAKLASINFPAHQPCASLAAIDSRLHGFPQADDDGAFCPAVMLKADPAMDTKNS